MTAGTQPPCLLSYAFATAPSPLQASSASAESPGLVEVWVSTGPTTVFCSEILLAVKIGTDPDDFANVPPSVTPNTTWWTASSGVPRPGTDLGLDDPSIWSTFALCCVSPQNWQIDYELIFAMTVSAVSVDQGTFRFGVAETSGPNATQLQQRVGVFTLQKGPPQLYLDNFVAISASAAAETEPLGEFASGSAIQLVWESNGASFALYAGGSATPIWTGADTSYLLPAGTFTADTTFTLVATSVGTPPVTLTETLSLAVSGAALDASAVTAGTVAVAGTLSATGTTALGTATAASLTVLDAVAAFGVRPMAPGSYASTTDGFVLGIATPLTDPPSPCVTWISGATSGGIQVMATAGNFMTWADLEGSDSEMFCQSGSFLLPVPQGQVCTLGVQKFGTDCANVGFLFYWIPFGANTGMVQVASGAELANRAGAAADAAAALFARRSSPALRDRLADILRRLAPHAQQS